MAAPSLRRSILGMALAGTLLAAAWVSSSEVESPPERTARDRQVSAAPAATAPRSRASTGPGVAELPPLRFDRLKRASASPVQADLFEGPPPPPPAKPAAPPPPADPEPPPLPFRFMGRIDEARDGAVFVLKGDVPIPVRAGDTVETDYRVERVDRDAIVFTYLPLGRQQTLSTGGGS